MPLIRRIPKFGFTPLPKEKRQILNLEALSRFPENSDVDENALFSAGLIKKGLPVKILAKGELKNPLKVTADAFSKKAQEKIAAVGGQAIIKADSKVKSPS